MADMTHHDLKPDFGAVGRERLEAMMLDFVGIDSPVEDPSVRESRAVDLARLLAIARGTLNAGFEGVFSADLNEQGIAVRVYITDGDSEGVELVGKV